MKFNMFLFGILTLSGMSFINLSAQNQLQQQENQNITGNTEAQPAASTQQDQTQTQTQTQKIYAPKPKPFADDLNIAGQFSFAIEKSSNFQDYKVIKQEWMSKLKLNTLDTLQTLNVKLKSAQNLIQLKKASIDSLSLLLTITQSELKSKNSFKFFGIMLSKAGYDSIMWAIIIGLFFGLGFMLAAFRRSFAVTSQTKKDLNDVKEEFESFRKKALKSKEEAVRQLYDELNKFKNKK